MQTISIWPTTSNVTSFPGSAVRTCWAQYGCRLKRYPYPWSLGEGFPLSRRHLLFQASISAASTQPLFTNNPQDESLFVETRGKPH